jgi:hypothetical protein
VTATRRKVLTTLLSNLIAPLLGGGIVWQLKDWMHQREESRDRQKDRIITLRKDKDQTYMDIIKMFQEYQAVVKKFNETQDYSLRGVIAALNAQLDIKKVTLPLLKINLLN